MYVAIYAVAKVHMTPEIQLLQTVATFYHHMLINANEFGSNLDYQYRNCNFVNSGPTCPDS